MSNVLEWLSKVVGAVVFGLVAFMVAWPAMEGIHDLLVPPPSLEWRISEAAQRAYEDGDTIRADRLTQALTLLNAGKPVRNLTPPF